MAETLESVAALLREFMKSAQPDPGPAPSIRGDARGQTQANTAPSPEGHPRLVGKMVEAYEERLKALPPHQRAALDRVIRAL